MQFRDVLAWFAFLMIIPFLWISDGMGLLELNNIILGASISVWTLIAQFYFRKK